MLFWSHFFLNSRCKITLNWIISILSNTNEFVRFDLIRQQQVTSNKSFILLIHFKTLRQTIDYNTKNARKSLFLYRWLVDILIQTTIYTQFVSLKYTDNDDSRMSTSGNRKCNLLLNMLTIRIRHTIRLYTVCLVFFSFDWNICRVNYCEYEYITVFFSF